MSEVIGSPSLNLKVKYAEMFADLEKVKGKVTGTFEDSNKRLAKSQENVMRQMQAQIDRFSGRKATNEINLLAQAVESVGGKAKLNAPQLARLTAEVDRLAAAGAKVPASLAGLQSSKLGAAFGSLASGGGIAGALAAIGPAGIAAAAGFGAVTTAATSAFGAVKNLAGEAEQWGNISAATGISVESVQKLQDYLVDAGFDADDLTKIMKKLQTEIATGGEGLKKFGIDIKTLGLEGKTTEEQLKAIAQAIMAIEDPMVRGAAATEAFGKGGARNLAAIAGIARGAYQDMAALSAAQVAELQRLDEDYDKAARAAENWKKRTLLAMADVLTFSTRLGETIRVQFQTQFGSLGEAPAVPDKRKGAIFQPPSLVVPKGPTDAELEREKQVARDREAATVRAAAAEKKLADARREQIALAERLRFVGVGLENARVTMEQDLTTRRDFKPTDLAAATEELNKFLGDGGPMQNVPLVAKQATQETVTLSDRLGSLASQLQLVAQTTGGLTGKVVGFAASLAGGLGGALQGLKTMKESTGGGLMGFLGKASGALGVVGSVVGVVGGLVSGIKSLFGGKSKEQKAAEEQAKKDAAAAARQARIDKDQNLRQGLGTARGGAEALMARLAEGGLSQGLSAALQAVIGKVSEALMKSGMGILDSRLSGSKEFGAAQGTAGDLATVMQGMRQAGMVDAGLMAATGGAAAEIQQQAIDAAKAAGLSDTEAAKAGSAAIAGLLREQLNASLQSGKELDENTKQLLKTAEENGISILADPAIESLDVQKEQLGVLKEIAGKGPGRAVGAAGGLGPMMTRDLGGGLGPLIQTHPGELVWVLPKALARGGILSASEGVYDGNVGAGAGVQGGAVDRSSAVSVSYTVSPNITEDPLSSRERREDLRRFTIDQITAALRQREPQLVSELRRVTAEA